MKATELQIGDWIKIGECDRYHGFIGKIAAINSITNYCIVRVRTGDDIFVQSDVFIEDIEPIPLTPEILEKNGWKLTHDKKDYMVDNSFGVNGKNRWMNWCISEHNLDIQQQDEKLDFYNLCIQRAIIPCDYVHELQHALRLCSLKELANNFQV